MVLSDSFDAMHGDIDFLARAELCNEDVGVGSADGVGRKGVDLLPGGFKHDVTRIDRGVGVQLVGVGFGLRDARNAFTSGGEVKDNGVVVGGVLRRVTGGGFCSMLERGRGRGGGWDVRDALMNHCMFNKAFLSPTSGMRPRRCDRTSSWIMEVLVCT